ncbi:MAG: amidohydrolase family protein [Elusimicrobiota bacterium]|jgi:hypothetical protein|nr:amidohydrolase family protein [Elusimicrobiota bacterium]
MPISDNHIHIGQFNEVYYEPQKISDTILETGVGSFSFSSTTSCKDGVKYKEIEKEILSIKYVFGKAHPFFGLIPEYIQQRIDIESVSQYIDYKGIKIHPLAQKWDLTNKKHLAVLNETFDYAQRQKLPVLIHTGNNTVDMADRFEIFFNRYKDIKFILSHCRPLENAIEIIKKYKNVFGDTAFVSNESLRKIAKFGVIKKMITGSDFPITHYLREREMGKYINIKQQYRNDFLKLKIQKNFIETGHMLLPETVSAILRYKSVKISKKL